jgi:hypothetical protein
MDATVRTAACIGHERLLKESHQTLVELNELLAGVLTIGMSGKERENEFRKRQAKYAKAYNNLLNHARNCEMCSFNSRFNMRSAA